MDLVCRCGHHEMDHRDDTGRCASGDDCRYFRPRTSTSQATSVAVAAWLRHRAQEYAEAQDAVGKMFHINPSDFKAARKTIKMVLEALAAEAEMKDWPQPSP